MSVRILDFRSTPRRKYIHGYQIIEYNLFDNYSWSVKIFGYVVIDRSSIVEFYGVHSVDEACKKYNKLAREALAKRIKEAE